MDITSFTMEKVRCFSDRQTLNIRPLTLLVGENSTGKTTTLGCLQVLADCLSGYRGANFDRRPYCMGVFKDIVTTRRPAEEAFKLGLTMSSAEGEELSRTFEFVKRENGFDPVINSVHMKFGDGAVLLKNVEKDQSKSKANFPFLRISKRGRGKNSFTVVCDNRLLDVAMPITSFPMFLLDKMEAQFDKIEASGGDAKSFARYMKEKRKLDIERPDVFSMPPVRSSPERTYDLSSELGDPAGGDIPMQLMRMETTRKEEWERLADSLAKFGKVSGLFKNIQIKRFDKSGGPFQLKFKVHSHSSSIMDVGYGVSQILPILVHILSKPRAGGHFMATVRKLFLIQQPEVHLHPRAQAEVSSLLANLATQGKHGFVVETHSDNIIDRARIEIKRKTIKPEDVALIYLHSGKTGVEVHNITFDENGNMYDVPRGYRKFFEREEDRLVGFES